MADILIVDDDADAREFLREICSHEGHHPLLCASAKDVDEVVGSNKPDLAIIDIMLPGEHGVSLAWRLRNTYENLPIVVVTGHLHSWETDDIEDCGVDCIMQKPCELKILRSTINRFLSYGRKASCKNCLHNPACKGKDKDSQAPDASALN